MNTDTVLHLTAGDFQTRWTLEGFGISIQEQVQMAGGNAALSWVNETLCIRVQNFDPTTLRAFVEALVRAAQKHGSTISITETQQPATVISNSEPDEIPWGTVVYEKLTRALLDRLPVGAFVVSNKRSDGEPVFAERVTGNGEREVLWTRAKLAGADKCMCRVLWSQPDFDNA